MEIPYRRAEAMETFRTGEEAEEVLGVPGLGFVPEIQDEQHRLIRDISAFSPVMESYRSLRVNLKFVTADAPVRSLMVTSSVPAEGKSTVVANLAMAYALAKKCVLVVDADLRRPSQHTLLGTKAAPGLTELLNGENPLDDAIRPTSVANVWCIPAGNPPSNPTELLESKEMARTIAELEERYDIVLFDSPPVLAVADSLVVAAQVGGTLLVIGWDETKVRNTLLAMKLFSRARATVLGTVLNRMGASSGYYYEKVYVPSADAETSPAPPATAEAP